MQLLKVGILGITGRMGHMIQQNLADESEAELIGGISHDSSEAERQDLFGRADVLIDFSHAETVSTHLTLANEHQTPIVMGTTGLTQNDVNLLNQVSQKLPCLYAPNMSTGITLLLHLVEQASKSLGEEFDIEIHETHHRHKADAPSGTALGFGKAAAEGRGKDFESLKQLNWTTGETRKRGLIGFSANRGGEVIGDHTISFYGNNEIVELKHRAQNRMIYAEGAVKAAKWLVKQNPGLYSMRNVLGL